MERTIILNYNYKQLTTMKSNTSKSSSHLPLKLQKSLQVTISQDEPTQASSQMHVPLLHFPCAEHGGSHIFILHESPLKIYIFNNYNFNSLSFNKSGTFIITVNII